MSSSYSSGHVRGDHYLGGLVGFNHGTGTVTNSYSIGSVTGYQNAGGLVGANTGTVHNSFWDVQTSWMAASSGGMGKTTAEMKSIATFTAAAWDMIAVAPSMTNPIYTWNLVDGETYPFLSWQPVS